MTPEERKLESLLGVQLKHDCAEAEGLGYQPKKFRTMMAVDGPKEACVQVIMSAKIPDGFLTLLELKRLDLTAEATVLRGPWKALFESEVLEEARKRLRQYQRPDLAI
ncbi:MAG TPA: hypothetical protein VMF67_11380 [Rhizomicrobium sp.]|nr:hypothetical protein [Rhizomicrobium sp.]